MAIVKRINGDAAGVVNVDLSLGGNTFASNAIIISTGIGKHPFAYKITGDSFTSPDQIGNGVVSGGTVVNGAVETVLRVFGIAGTILAYQIDGGSPGQISLLAESSGWGNATVTGAAALQVAVVALGNRTVDTATPATAYNFANIVVSEANGMKFG